MNSTCAYCKIKMDYKSPFKYPMCTQCAWDKMKKEMHFPLVIIGDKE